MIAAGIGCRKGAEAAEIEAAIAAALERAWRPLARSILGGDDEEARGERELRRPQPRAAMRLVFVHAGRPRDCRAAAPLVGPRARAGGRAFGGGGRSARRLRLEATLILPRIVVGPVARARERRGDAMTVHFIGAGPGAADLITCARARSHRALPSLPLCRLDRAARASRLLPEVRASSIRRRSRSTRSRPSSWRRTTRPRRGAPAIGRPFGFQRACRAAPQLKRRGIPYTLTPGVPLRRRRRRDRLRTDRARDRAASCSPACRVAPRPCPKASGSQPSPRRAQRSPSILRSALRDVVEQLKPSYGELSGRGRGRCQPARRADRARHARRYRGKTRRRADRAHGADPCRPRARGGGFPRQRALRCRLSPPLPREVPRERRGRRVAHELADAVEHRDLDFDGDAGDNGGGCLPCGAGDFIAERHAFFGGMGEGFAAVLAARMRSPSAREPPAFAARPASAPRSTEASPRMEIEQALRELSSSCRRRPRW